MVQTPYDLLNIETAADMLLKHMRGKELIVMIPDSDADGFTSAAILYNYFKMQEDCGDFGPLPEIKFIFHDEKSHGLSDMLIMKQIRDLHPALVIVPDASGTDEQYAALNELGCDVCVIDHHEMLNTGDGVKTIVVNNQMSPNYKNKSLSGAGMCFQLCRVLDDKLDFQCAEFHLDLVSIGLAADVMDFRSDETRFLIFEGMMNINLPFLEIFRKDLCYQISRQYDPDKVRLNYKTISWNIAPLINAITRIGTLQEKEMTLNALLFGRAEVMVPSGKRGALDEEVPLVTEALRLATNARSRQNRRKDKLIEAIDNAIKEQGLLEDKVIIVDIDDFDKDQRALSGLIANGFVTMYKRPVILLFKDDKKDTYSGSMRCPENVEAFNGFRDQIQKSHLALYASGHPYAAGVGIKPDNIQELRDHFNAKYQDVDTSPTLYVDFLFEADEDLTDIAELMDELQDYWGRGMDQPLVAVQHVPLRRHEIVLFKADTPSPTLNINLPMGGTCIRFRSSKEEFDSLILPSSGDVEQYYLATIVGELEINEYRDKRTPQIKITDYMIEGVRCDF